MFVMWGRNGDDPDELQGFCLLCSCAIVDAADFVVYAAIRKGQTTPACLVHRGCADSKLVARLGPGYKMIRLSEALRRLAVRLTV